MKRELQKVERAAAKVAVSYLMFEVAIRQAHEAGLPLRKIAAAAGVSHTQVRRILSR